LRRSYISGVEGVKENFGKAFPDLERKCHPLIVQGKWNPRGMRGAITLNEMILNKVRRGEITAGIVHGIGTAGQPMHWKRCGETD
jgi:hypothetical protein